MILKKLKFEVKFWFENLFKYKHGHAKNCIGKKAQKCPVCKTPWPIIEKTPTRKYLESIDYYNKYKTIYKDDGRIMYMPKGLTGEELIEIAKKLKPEYDILTRGTGEEELKKRGALEGYNEKDINKS